MARRTQFAGLSPFSREFFALYRKETTTGSIHDATAKQPDSARQEYEGHSLSAVLPLPVCRVSPALLLKDSALTVRSVLRYIAQLTEAKLVALPLLANKDYVSVIWEPSHCLGPGWSNPSL